MSGSASGGAKAVPRGNWLRIGARPSERKSLYERKQGNRVSARSSRSHSPLRAPAPARTSDVLVTDTVTESGRGVG